MLALENYIGEWVAASAGTDGSDYLPGVAGAIIDNSSILELRRQSLDIRTYIERFDSNTLLMKLGNALIKTGDTGTNVGDIMVYTFKR